MGKISLTPNNWAYSIRKNKGKGEKAYGWNVTLYRNGKRLESQPTSTAFGSPFIAASYARRVFLSIEHNVEAS